jgi:hypothetical protein
MAQGFTTAGSSTGAATRHLPLCSSLTTGRTAFIRDFGRIPACLLFTQDAA